MTKTQIVLICNKMNRRTIIAINIDFIGSARWYSAKMKEQKILF